MPAPETPKYGDIWRYGEDGVLMFVCPDPAEGREATRWLRVDRVEDLDRALVMHSFYLRPENWTKIDEA